MYTTVNLCIYFEILVYQCPQNSNKVHRMRKFNKNIGSFLFIISFIRSVIRKWMYDCLKYF